jgi:hypothetical protein
VQFHLPPISQTDLFNIDLDAIITSATPYYETIISAATTGTNVNGGGMATSGGTMTQSPAATCT